jgi:acetyl-CoA acetyltransferase
VGGRSQDADSARRAYEAAGVTTEYVDVVELHDATAGAELELYEELGLASRPG